MIGKELAKKIVKVSKIEEKEVVLIIGVDDSNILSELPENNPYLAVDKNEKNARNAKYKGYSVRVW